MKSINKYRVFFTKFTHKTLMSEISHNHRVPVYYLAGSNNIPKSKNLDKKETK